jgi:hypothetical protein
MQKEINDIVADFQAWKGNSYTLAKLIAELVKERAADKASLYPEVAQEIMGL